MSENKPTGFGFSNRPREAYGTHCSTCYVGKSGFGTSIRWGNRCTGCQRHRAMTSSVGFYNRKRATGNGVFMIMKLFR
ncbi:hypothetical protein ACF0H5_006881 [Mactra antiquata]